MVRKQSHFENSEPLFEKFLGELRYRKIVKHIPPNSKALDLGCGFDGKLLRKIRDGISAGFGLDISVNPDCRDEKIFLVKHDLAHPLPFRDNEFDVAASLANLEHLHDPEQVLKETHRVLKPGGLLLLTAPSTFSKPVLEFLSFRLGLISQREIRDHKRYANKKILVNLCGKIGFSSWKHRYFQLGMNNFLTATK